MYRLMFAMMIVTFAAAPGLGRAEDLESGSSSFSVASQEDDLMLGAVALMKAAKENKYLFVLFFKTEDERTRAMRSALESSLKDLSKKAMSVSVDITSPLEKPIVDKFAVSRAPMPLLLAVAPNGAVTKNWLHELPPGQLAQAFASPAHERSLKCLQDRRLVLLCVQSADTRHNQEALAGVKELKADPQYNPQVEIIVVDPKDKAETKFLEQLKVNLKSEEAVTLFLAPPGTLIGTFTGATTKAALVTAVTKASAGCDPSSGCCPPKKKPATDSPPNDKNQP